MGRQNAGPAALAGRGARLVVDGTPWLTVPVVLLLLFPSPWMPVGFLGALLLFFARWIAKSSPLPVSPANLPVLILLGMTTIGFVISPAPELGVLTAAQVVASLTVFYVLLDRIHRPADLWRAAGLVTLLGLALALVAPFTVRWTPEKLFDLQALYESVWPRLPKETNPNILAGALVLVLPIALALLEHPSRRWRILGASSLAPIAAVVILLQSRGALFGLAAGLSIWMALHWRWTVPLIPLGFCLVFLYNSWSGGPPPAEFVFGKIAPDGGGTFLQRQDMWVQSLYLLRESPALGIGLGAYPQVAPYAPPHSAANPGRVENHTHNLFLQIALDTGILGLAAFAVLLLMAARQAWGAYSAGFARPLAAGVLVALVVLVVHGMGDVIVWGTAKSSLVLWMVLALALAPDRRLADGEIFREA